MVEKIALAPCNGMSANGLVGRVACGDCRAENENVISICMGSTSADIEGNNNEMLKKYPIIAVNGCSGGCVNKILSSKGIEVKDTVFVYKVLEGTGKSSKDPFRLDDEAEECVKIVKTALNEKASQIL